MRIGELADRARVSLKALRYYESMGLLAAARLPNGYRDYDESDVRVVEEIRQLSALGIRVEDTRPFVECLVSGHENGDDCLASVEAYREAIAELDARARELAERRDRLTALLAQAEARAACGCEVRA
ncbi:MAG: MerR family transcriptional regulator [Protaetiibacter sp.]